MKVTQGRFLGDFGLWREDMYTAILILALLGVACAFGPSRMVPKSKMQLVSDL